MRELEFFILLSGLLLVCIGGEVNRKSKTFWKPLIFKSNGELLEHKDERDPFNFAKNEELFLSCSPNYFKNFNRKTFLKVKYDGKDMITEHGNVLSPEDCCCDLRVIEEVFSPVTGCSDPSWNSTKYGYVNPVDDETIIIGESCYDTNEGKTIFAHTKLSNENNLMSKLDKRFLVTNPHPSSRYKIDLLKSLDFSEIYSRLSKVVGREFVELDMSRYIDNNLLRNVQMRDVQKLGWNYFVQSSEQKSIQMVKQAIKEYSKVNNVDLYVGGYGVAKFFGEGGKTIEVYSDDFGKRFPMPKFIWFLVKTNSKSITFVVYNNKEEADKDERDGLVLCPSQCQKAQRILNYVGNDVLCCSYNDLRKNFPDLPMLH